MMASHRTCLGVMSGGVTNKAMTGAEEQIHIIIQQVREGIKHEAVDSYGYGSGEN
jgi:hypothetical protein